MPRWFNTAGPCTLADHYMIPPGRRIPQVRRIIDQKHCFVLHAPRQSGGDPPNASDEMRGAGDGARESSG